MRIFSYIVASILLGVAAYIQDIYRHRIAFMLGLNLWRSLNHTGMTRSTSPSHINILPARWGWTRCKMTHQQLLLQRWNAHRRAMLRPCERIKYWYSALDMQAFLSSPLGAGRDAAAREAPREDRPPSRLLHVRYPQGRWWLIRIRPGQP